MGIRARHRAFIEAIRAGDERRIEDTIVAISRRRRHLAPLALAVGAFVALFEGLKLVVSNWRLAVLEALPAMWAWASMLDLRLHVLRGKGVRVLHGPVLYLVVVLITLGTVGAVFLNTAFAFALAAPGPPKVRPALVRAAGHKAAIVFWGTVVGGALGVATMISGAWGRGWFTLTLGVAVACLMFSYVEVPSRILGRPEREELLPRRDRMAAGLIAGAVGAVVCTPPYLIGRLGIMMLGSRALLVPAVIVLLVGFGLQAGAAGSVRAIKMSYRLRATRTGRARTDVTGPAAGAHRAVRPGGPS